MCKVMVQKMDYLQKDWENIDIGITIALSNLYWRYMYSSKYLRLTNTDSNPSVTLIK
jgi:hypothetical protein